MIRAKHELYDVVVLKLDVEGAEYEILDDLIRSGPSRSFMPHMWNSTLSKCGILRDQRNTSWNCKSDIHSLRQARASANGYSVGDRKDRQPGRYDWTLNGCPDP
ncbi:MULTISPECIES: hypothetical protein [Mesorhizobium]|uniref:hypothetical protein n=1 Tax=Mesorhizobium sp. TaxID=1871066 RepID=UPI00257E03D8|nr:MULTISPECIES: hypothetical protein [Mesorhizobium]